MTHQGKPINHDQSPTPETIQQFLQVQQEQAAIESQRLKLSEKRIETDAKLAERSIELNAQVLLAEPGYRHKRLVTIASFMILFLSIFFVFIGWLVFMGKEEFVLKFLNWLVHVVFGIIGYLVGRVTTKNTAEQNSP